MFTYKLYEKESGKGSRAECILESFVGSSGNPKLDAPSVALNALLLMPAYRIQEFEREYADYISGKKGNSLNRNAEMCFELYNLYSCIRPLTAFAASHYREYVLSFPGTFIGTEFPTVADVCRMDRQALRAYLGERTGQVVAMLAVLGLGVGMSAKETRTIYDLYRETAGYIGTAFLDGELEEAGSSIVNGFAMETGLFNPFDAYAYYKENIEKIRNLASGETDANG